MSFAPLHPERRPALPLAPMLDVMFLLLIFFVTTYSFSDEERVLEVNVPSADSAVDTAKHLLPITVNILKDGKLMLASRVYEPPALQRILTQLLANSPDSPVIVRADADVPHGRVVQVYDIARLAGARQVLESVQGAPPPQGG